MSDDSKQQDETGPAGEPAEPSEPSGAGAEQAATPPNETELAIAQAKAEAAAAETESAQAKAVAAEAETKSARAIDDAADLAKTAATVAREVAATAADAAKQAETRAEDLAQRASAARDGAAAPKFDSDNRVGFLFGVIPAIGLILLALFWFNESTGVRPDEQAGELRVIASAAAAQARDAIGDPRATPWTINGVVLENDKPLEGASVLAVMTDQHGNSFSGSETTSTDGAFGLTIDPSNGTAVKISEITVSATSGEEGFLSRVKRGAVTISPTAQKTGGWTRASADPFVAAMVLFFVSFLLSLWHTVHPIMLRAAYYASVVLALGYTAAMIWFISMTAQELAGSQKTDDVISLGFAHVFFGSYVKDAVPQWNLSLTTPPVLSKAREPAERNDSGEAGEGERTATLAAAAGSQAAAANGTGDGTGATGQPRPGGGQSAQEPREVDPDAAAAPAQARTVGISNGFGAPLWLLLLAVVGSAVFTIKLVVDSLKTPITFDADRVRERMAEILRHEVYILFAPLGAIFVYQLLVAAGSASEPITVGLAGLASGIALNNVLEKAWKGAESATQA